MKEEEEEEEEEEAFPPPLFFWEISLLPSLLSSLLSPLSHSLLSPLSPLHSWAKVLWSPVLKNTEVFPKPCCFMSGTLCSPFAILCWVSLKIKLARVTSRLSPSSSLQPRVSYRRPPFSSPLPLYRRLPQSVHTEWPIRLPRPRYGGRKGSV